MTELQPGRESNMKPNATEPITPPKCACPTLQADTCAGRRWVAEVKAAAWPSAAASPA